MAMEQKNEKESAAAEKERRLSRLADHPFDGKWIGSAQGCYAINSIELVIVEGGLIGQPGGADGAGISKAGSCIGVWELKKIE